MTIHQFIKKRPHLVWYVAKKNLGKLDEASIVEHVLNYGDWDDVQGLIKILGLKKTAKIFREKSKGDKFGRQNYDPQVKNYFNLYFNNYVQYGKIMWICILLLGTITWLTKSLRQAKKTLAANLMKNCFGNNCHILKVSTTPKKWNFFPAFL